MILGVDIGNTNIVLGILDGDTLINECRLSTAVNDSAEEYAIKLNSILEICKINPEDIEGSVISSVVPPLIRTVSKAIMLITGKKSIVIGPGVKTGLNIKTNNPAERRRYGSRCELQALKNILARKLFSIWVLQLQAPVIDKNGCFIGCSILCGVKTALNALASGTAHFLKLTLLPQKCNLHKHYRLYRC